MCLFTDKLVNAQLRYSQYQALPLVNYYNIYDPYVHTTGLHIGSHCEVNNCVYYIEDGS